MIVGLGVDVVDLARFARAMDRTPRLAPRLFTDAERSRHGEARATASLAARFAAKEATMKALGAHAVSRWLEIEIAQDALGEPSIVLSGDAAAVAAARGVTRLHVSMSHDGGVAMATVVAEGAA